MAKGIKETFKVELFPDTGQRRIIDELMTQAGTVRRLVMRELVRSFQSPSSSRLLSLQEIGKSARLRFLELDIPDLREPAISAAISAAYDGFRHVISSGGHLNANRGRLASPDVEVPKDGVVFSVMENAVMIPQVGLVRHLQNRFITVNYGKVPEGGVTENKQEMNRRLRRMSVARRGSTYYLVLDCRLDGSAFSGP